MPGFFDLRAEDVFENNALAFRVAEDELDLPSLLDPQDMVDCEDPDKFSIVTYVSQFYHLFKDADSSRSSPAGSPVVTALRRDLAESSENDSLLQSSSSSENTPLGTPSTQKKKQASKPAALVFNQADLIAKYGEEIFSKSSPDKKKGEEEEERGCVTPRAKTSVGAICNGLVRARISSAEEKKS